MSNPTTPFNWQMPTNTDLVTDLPADFEVFGQAVATSMADLLGGTTGQILSKATNADMDFTWITNDIGDITAVTATSPLTGGGTSGAITVGIQSASTSQSGAVQLSDSTSTTSSVLASTPTATKSAYDLANTANTAAGTAQTTANAAIPKSTVTTAGDVIYATGSSAVTRLGIGTAGQVLKVNAGATAPEWGSGGAGALTYVGGATFTGSSSQSLNNVFTSTYTNYMIVSNIDSVSTGTNICFKLRVSGTDASTLYYSNILYNDLSAGTTAFGNISVSSGAAWKIADLNTTGKPYGFSFNLFNPQRTTTTTFQSGSHGYDYSGTVYQSFTGGVHGTSAAYDGITIFPASGTFTGTIRVYGIANS